MNRRGFLATLSAAFTAVCGWRVTPPPAPAGIALAFHAKAFSIVMDPLPTRWDVIYGWGTFRPEMAVRVIDESPKRLTLTEIASYGPASRLPL